MVCIIIICIQAQGGTPTGHLPARTSATYCDLLHCIFLLRSSSSGFEDPGCTNKVVNGGVCIRHGAKTKRKICSDPGCTNVALNGGVCIRHGAKSYKRGCSATGCTTRAKWEGLCMRHHKRKAEEERRRTKKKIEARQGKPHSHKKYYHTSLLH